MARALRFGQFRVDLLAKQLRKNGDIIPLSPKALDLLVLLAEHSGEVLTRDQLFDALWPDIHVGDHSLSVQVLEIRKALGEDIKKPQYLETRHRRGYCFAAAVTREEETDQPAAGPPAAVPETRYANSNGVNIAYQIVGDGPIDLVLVLGWVSHLEYCWTQPRLARFLNRLGSFARVILFDKRGTGLSDRVPLDQLPTIEQRMEDVHAVMDKAGSERAVICGESEGGCMSAVFAATYPARTRALVMIGAYARRLWAPDYPWAPTPDDRELFLREIREHWGGPVGLAERAPTLSNDPAFRSWWAAYLRMGASPGAALALTTMNSQTDIRQVLPLVRVPTLVVHRAGDLCLLVEDGRYLASHIRGARYVELPGDDHLPYVGNQDEILDAIEPFLTEVRAESHVGAVLATAIAIEFENAGNVYRSVTEEVRGLLRRYRAAGSDYFEGRVVAAFDGPVRAVSCAWAVQEVARRGGVRVRIGVHTGECATVSGPGLRGTGIEVATEIQRRASWSEVLASGTVRDLVAGSQIHFVEQGQLFTPQLGRWPLLRVEAPALAVQA